jgi:HPt (histidine-containing phosphotransfer) domain-containing protein
VMDELVAKFLPRFTVLARERLRKATDTATQRRHDQADAAAHDMHSLAGEAGLLGLEGVITVARQAEEAARRFGATGAEADAVTLTESLTALERAVNDATAERPS